MNYSAQQSAQGLASLGRGNDTMLMHVTPREVQGLQGLAMAHGGSLTINPQTGLPEAGFFDSLLPMVGGAALSPFMGPMAAGLLIGGVTALTSGDLGAGVMAGLGAGGGAGLGKTFANMGKNAVGGISGNQAIGAVGQDIASQLPVGTAQNISMFTPSGTFGNQTMNAALTGSSVGSSAIPSAISPTTIGPGVNSAVNAMGAAPTSTQIAQSSLAPSSLAPSGPYGNMSKGFGEFIKDPFGEGFEAFKVAGGEGGKDLTTGEAAYQLGSPIATLALSSMEPEMPKPYIDPETGKYRGPQGQLNLSDRFDTGLRLAQGGTIATGGIRDLYGSSDNQTQAPISKDGYGLGRLSNLANEQAMTTAQTLGYAEGGDVSDYRKDQTALNLNLVGGPTDTALENTQNPLLKLFGGLGASSGATSPLIMGNFGSPIPFESILKQLSPPKPKAYALNLKSGKQEAQYAEGGDVSGSPSADVAAEMALSEISPESVRGDMVDDSGRLPYTYDRILTRGALDFPRIRAIEYNPSTYAGALKKQERMAHGGYLNGDGDGMSDSIPATIEGKQPARLADGEFVVPADVVSHLGNGSSKAGSKRLYAMLDKVRHARTGNKKQGKEIKADKYLPA